MANVWGTIKDAGQWIAMESAALLSNKRGISKRFNTNFSKEFQPKQGTYPIGSSFKVQYPQQNPIREGLEYVGQGAETRFATVSIGTPFGIDLPEIDSIENALSTPSKRDKFSELYLDPNLSKLASEIESRSALYAYIHSAGVVGVLGTNPTTLDATSGAARQKIAELADVPGEKGLFVPPVVMRGIRTANAALFNPANAISQQNRTGVIDYADGFNWEESAVLYRHTAATWQSSVVLASAPDNGATTLSLTVTSGDTFKKGDKISIANVLPVNLETKRTFGTDAKTFTITSENATISGTSATITVEPAIYFSGPWQNVNSQPAASAALTLWPGTTSPNGKVGNLGLAIPPNAFALVSLELENFPDWEVCKSMRDPDSGVSIRFGMGSDIRSSKKIRRLDVCIGFGSFYSDLAHVVACG